MTSGAPMRVLAVMPSLTPEAGAETSLAAVTPWLVAHGVEMHLALFSPVQTLAPALAALGVTVHDLSDRRGSVRRVLALHRLWRSVRPDVVHATLAEAHVPAQVAALLGWRRRVLVTWANTPVVPGENPRIGCLKLAGVRAQGVVLAAAARTRFHAVTSGVARVMRREWLVPSGRVRVAERGRDAARFAPLSEDEIDATRRELGLAEGERLVLCVGRQDLLKGHARLVRAFDAVAAAHPDVVLGIAGREGSGSAALQAALGDIAHADRVRLLGHRDDVPRLWQAASVAVCSSTREGAAGALIEAMASGTPIVTTRVDGLEDVLIDGENAVVVEADGLAGGLTRMLDDAATATRLATRARDDFEARFTVDRAAEALLGVYRWAAA